MQLLIFYIFGFGAVFAAVSMVVARKPVVSALFLILNMLCLAALYAQLDAHLIAVLQILVYAGAIMVLVLFVIMLLNLREKSGAISRHKIAMQFIGIVLMGGLMINMVALINSDKIAAVGKMTEEFGTVAGVGKVLFTSYLLPFEVASVMLLAAIIGAVILTKRKI